MGILKQYYRISLVKKIFVAMVVGVVLGMMFGGGISVIYPLGELFIRLLKMIVMPIILFTILVGAASIDPRQLGRIGIKIIALYMMTSVLAIVIGLVMANAFDLGSGLSLPGLSSGYDPNVQAPSVVDVFLNIVPSNPFASLAEGSPLPIIFFALIFGLALSYLRHSKNDRVAKSADSAFCFFEVCAEAMFKITRGVLEYAPIGIVAIMATVVGQSGPEVIGPFLMLIVAGYAGMAIMIVIVYPSLLLAFGLNPLKFFRGVREAMLMAYTTRTSSGTLPVSMDCAENRLGVSNKIASFSLPLGATINMDGTSLYLAIEVVFAAHVFGIDLSLSQQIIILITALLASIGTAGVPSASLVMLVGVLKSVKLPVSIIPMFAGFDPVCDMMRTMTNVTGDLACTAVVAKMEGQIDMSRGVWAGADEALPVDRELD